MCIHQVQAQDEPVTMLFLSQTSCRQTWRINDNVTTDPRRTKWKILEICPTAAQDSVLGIEESSQGLTVQGEGRGKQGQKEHSRTKQ